MAHDTPDIQAERRERTGSRYSKRLRDQGRLPAIVYGHKKGAVAISVDRKETLTILRDGAHLVNLKVSEKESQTCLVKDLQFGYLGDNVIHIDFARVDLNEEVTVNVRLHYSGDPKSAKVPGAVLTTDMTELEIICKAGEIPGEIVVDIENLEQSITVGEVQLPDGVRCELDPETPIIHIDIVEEIEDAEEAEVVGDAEPEVITEAKDDESASDDAEAAEAAGNEDDS